MKKTIIFSLLLSALIGGCTEENSGSLPNNPDTTNITPASGDYYVDAVNGSDLNNGSENSPFQTIEYAFAKANSSELIYVKGGICKVSDLTKYQALKIAGHNGVDSTEKIKIWAYPGSKVILDCAEMTANDDGIVGLRIDASNIHIKGFEVINLPQHIDPSTGYGNYNVGILVAGNNILLENCSAHDCGGTGIHIGGQANGAVILNCDSYNNYDPYTASNATAYPGGNADGFHVTISGLESKQTLRNCRAWNNSDDGYDFFGTDGYIEISGCMAIKNGYLANGTESEGDGSGFKLGATNGDYAVLKKNVKNCLSALNRAEGFTQNNGRCIMSIYNNTAYNNGSYQFDFGNTFTGQSQLELKNNVAVGAHINYTPYALHSNNSWDSQVNADDNDFQSIDINELLKARDSDGNLQDFTAFHLKTESDLNKTGYDGVNMGAF
jgi:hypothetical protein